MKIRATQTLLYETTTPHQPQAVMANVRDPLNMEVLGKQSNLPHKSRAWLTYISRRSMRRRPGAGPAAQAEDLFRPSARATRHHLPSLQCSFLARSCRWVQAAMSQPPRHLPHNPEGSRAHILGRPRPETQALLELPTLSRQRDQSILQCYASIHDRHTDALDGTSPLQGAP